MAAPRFLVGWPAFDLVAASWERFARPVEDVLAAANLALVDGCDSPSLRVLAGLQGTSWSDVRPLLTAIRLERGLGPLTTDELDELQMLDVVGAIARGTTRPRKGVREAFALLTELDRHGDDDLSTIAYLDDSYDLVGTVFSDAAALDVEALRLSREFLARRGIDT